jgi:hypothetical protein
MDQRLAALRRVCDEGGVLLPPNVEAPLILDDQFSAPRREVGVRLLLGCRGLAHGLAAFHTPGRV